MKNTWAYGIVAVFIGFVLLMVSMAVIAGKHTERLVVKDYYKAELQFQQQIDKTKNAEALAQKPTISLTKNAAVEVFFPQAIYADGVVGKIMFYRANSPEMDFELPVVLGADAKQIIPTEKLKKGRWKVELNWQTNGLLYYTEQVINI
ncbi:MAG: hypothetical protein EOP53_15920 [Sphingobacteriales bacterium]|nr:MAG: hypothetical protein EOP53_15920 [Sphingobacteriales bacterium]